MEFTEELGKQTIEKFGLDQKTYLVWKTRKSIPDRYFKEDYQHREKMGKTGTIEQLKVNRLIDVLSNAKINTQSIFKIAGITQKWLMLEMSRSAESRQSKIVYLSDAEYLSISNEIKKLRLEIKEILEGVESGSSMGTSRKKAFCSFIINDPRIFREPIFGSKVGNKISAVKKLKRDHYLEFSPSEYDSMYNQLGILIFEL